MTELFIRENIALPDRKAPGSIDFKIEMFKNVVTRLKIDTVAKQLRFKGTAKHGQEKCTISDVSCVRVLLFLQNGAI